MKSILKFRIIVLLLVLYKAQVSAQNLVPNPGFEIFDTCPSAVSQIRYAVPWFQPSLATPDFYHSCGAGSSPVAGPVNCDGQFHTHSGIGMAGFITLIQGAPQGSPNYHYNEYVAAELTTTLIANATYYVLFYVRSNPNTDYATSSIGAYFTSVKMTKQNVDTFNVIPQVSNPASNFIAQRATWTKIQGSFKAAGGEKYIYIGNFRGNISGYFQSLPINTVVPCPGPGTNSYYFVDDICVSPSPNYCTIFAGIEKNDPGLLIGIYPNPVADKVKIIHMRSENIRSLMLKNIQGSEVIKQAKIDNSEYILDVSDLERGIYILTINLGDKQIHKRLVRATA